VTVDARPWPTVDDCRARLGLAPATPDDEASLAASLDAVSAWVIKARPDLAPANPGDPAPDIEPDAWQGIVILACLDYRAGNTPNGFAGYDGGGYAGTDTAERFRAHQLLRVQRYVPPRVG
jgi:hypothetical protein